MVFVDSTALGVLASGVRSIGAQGGTLDVVCGNANNKPVFEIAGLNRVLLIYRSCAEALAA